MTYKEYAQTIQVDKLINMYCPMIMNKSFNYINENTAIYKKGKVKGCRGITCEQCWNQEIKETD